MDDTVHREIREEIEKNGIVDFLTIVLEMCSLVDNIPEDIYLKFKAFMRDISSHERKLSPEMQKAIDYIEENYRNHISLMEIAEHVGFSREYFSRTFKGEMGEGFIDYLNKKRIEEVKKYIADNPKCIIKKIFGMFGFTNVQHFIRIFKIMTGENPQAFKKRMAELKKFSADTRSGGGKLA